VEPGFVKVIHPETGGIAEVPEIGLFQYYLSGWRRLAADEDITPPPVPEPEPVTFAEVAAPAPEPAPKKEK
jgi:hypothetical protein